MVYIYTINCPTTGLVRYVGKTKDTKNRFRKHLTQKNNTKKCKGKVKRLIKLVVIDFQ